MFDAFHAATTADTTEEGKTTTPAVQIYVTATIEDFIGEQTRARLVGGGTIPHSLFRHYLPDAAIVGIIFDGNGQVLWHGRDKRYATPAQISALRIRDEGCVLCGRDAADCEAHHVIPFHSPAKGQTNTDELALVDSDCHHHIHANNITLEADRGPNKKRKLRWRPRPARLDELPP